MLLISLGFTEIGANALAALIVGLVVGIIAWAMISKGIAALRANNWKLERTAASVGRDAEVVKEKAS